MVADPLEPSKRWLPFTAGIAVGLATGLLGVAVAVAAERARRRAAGRRHDPPMPSEPAHHGARPEHAPVVYPPPQEAELDEELAQTFPASDPLPISHRVD